MNQRRRDSAASRSEKALLSGKAFGRRRSPRVCRPIRAWATVAAAAATEFDPAGPRTPGRRRGPSPADNFTTTTTTTRQHRSTTAAADDPVARTVYTRARAPPIRELTPPPPAGSPERAAAARSHRDRYPASPRRRDARAPVCVYICVCAFVYLCVCVCTWVFESVLACVCVVVCTRALRVCSCTFFFFFTPSPANARATADGRHANGPPERPYRTLARVAISALAVFFFIAAHQTRFVRPSARVRVRLDLFAVF